MMPLYYRNIIVDNSRVGVDNARVGPEELIDIKKGFFKVPKKAAGKHYSSAVDIRPIPICSGVYQFTATINAETYKRQSSETQRLRPAVWAIVKKGEEDKVVYNLFSYHLLGNIYFAHKYCHEHFIYLQCKKTYTSCM